MQKDIVSEIPGASEDAEFARLAAWTEEETREEKLLADLLAANESLSEVLKLYEDLERQAAGAREAQRAKAEWRVSARHHTHIRGSLR